MFILLNSDLKRERGESRSCLLISFQFWPHLSFSLYNKISWNRCSYVPSQALFFPLSFDATTSELWPATPLKLFLSRSQWPPYVKPSALVWTLLTIFTNKEACLVLPIHSIAHTSSQLIRAPSCQLLSLSLLYLLILLIHFLLQKGPECDCFGLYVFQVPKIVSV